MLKSGDQSISAAYLGGAEIKKAYLGESVVFDVSAPPVGTYTISASIDPAGSGTVSGAGTYREGETATITAAPEDGYKFTGWSENGVTVSEDEAYSFTVTGDRTLVAVFEVEKTSRLPEGYTEVEYIRSLVSNSLISGNYRYQPCVFIGNTRNDTRFTCKVFIETFPTLPTSVSATVNTYSYGNHIFSAVSGNNGMKLWISPLGIVISVSYYGNAVTYANKIIPNTTESKWYDIYVSFSGESVTVDGLSYLFPTPSGGSPTWSSFSASIGNRGSCMGSEKYLCNYSIGEFTLSSESNTSTSYNKHGIPAQKDSNSQIGFYNVDGNTWLGPYTANATTGTPIWAPGPAV